MFFDDYIIGVIKSISHTLVVSIILLYCFSAAKEQLLDRLKWCSVFYIFCPSPRITEVYGKSFFHANGFF